MNKVFRMVFLFFLPAPWSFSAKAAAPIFCFQLPGFSESTTRIQWSEKSLLFLLNELNRSGFKLYASHFRTGKNLALEAAIKRIAGFGVSGYGVYKVTRRQFGNWEAGLRKIGVDPQEHNAQVIWNEKEVLDLLKYLADKLTPLSQSNLRKNGDALIEAYTFARFGHSVKARGFESRLVAIFGSWDKALIALNIDPNTVHSQVSWTPDLVVQSIQQLHAAEVDLSVLNMVRGETSIATALLKEKLNITTSTAALHDRGIHYFKSWDAALTAAGLNPAEIRHVPPKMEWTTAKFFRAMTALENHQIPLNYELLASNRLAQINPVLQEALDFPVSGNALVQAGRALFGSWVKARQRYLDRKNSRFVWSQALVNKWIQYLLSIPMKVDELSIATDFSGKYSLTISLAAGKVILSQELARAGELLYGSWRQALLRNPEANVQMTLPQLKITEAALSKMMKDISSNPREIELLAKLDEILAERGPLSESMALIELNRRLEHLTTRVELQNSFRSLSEFARGYE